MASIFMYHAVGDSKDIEGSDPHYAVTCSQFEQQVQTIKESVPLAEQLLTQSKIETNCITFDDGHLSNYTNAFPRLKEFGLTAEFYINSAFVGEPNYMNWSQLAEMQSAGMSIQSHGHHHEYFSDLTDAKIEQELFTSKSLIEEKLGTKVIVFAPPGGRYDARVVSIAQKLGYLCMATSEPGVVSKRNLFTFPRFAIIHNTSPKTIKSWCSPYSIASVKQLLRYSTFSLAKRILGNKNYERMRARFLGDGTY